MEFPIQIKRYGNNANISNIIPMAGEPVINLDTGKLYIGDGKKSLGELSPIGALTKEEIISILETGNKSTLTKINVASGTFTNVTIVGGDTVIGQPNEPIDSIYAKRITATESLTTNTLTTDKIKVAPAMYGTSLPSTGEEGQMFFLLKN